MASCWFGVKQFLIPLSDKLHHTKETIIMCNKTLFVKFQKNREFL